MLIDIVSYTSEQLAGMKSAQLQKILSAQLKKNALLRKLEEDVAEVKRLLIDRGVFSSTLFAAKEVDLRMAYNAAVTEIREALLFSLGDVENSGNDGEGGDTDNSDGNSSGGNNGGTTNPPYSVNYALSEEDRMKEVKAYYETAYTDATARFNAFSNDTFARTYLGAMYAPLYHYFEDFTM